MLAEKRHNARVIVLEKLFESQYIKDNPQGNNLGDLSIDEMCDVSDIDSYDEQFAHELFDETVTHLEKIDSLIIKYAPEWPLANIPRTDLAILRMAILEGFILKLTPPKIVIDEAIELAKEFCNDQSRKFISGVLGTIYDTFENKQNDNE